MIYLYANIVLLSPGGGIGRRAGLKIRLGLNPVPVQVWPRAPLKRHSSVSFLLNLITKFIYYTYLVVVYVALIELGMFFL